MASLGNLLPAGMRAAAPLQTPKPTAEQRSDLRTTWLGLFAWLLGALAALGIFAVSGAASTRWQTASTAMLVAVASASLGVLMGFLFGIPRSLQQDGNGSAAGGTGTAPTESRLRVNTNLEQISDWLTKILVGVGLTQIKDLGPRLWSVAGEVAPGLGNSKVVAAAVMINFSIWGFFVGYLLTRLFLARAFANAEGQALVAQEEKAFDLTQKGAYVTAAQQFADAIAQLTPGAPPEQRQRLYEGYIYNLLYAPGGYKEAIRAATEYIASPANPASGRVWAYLSAAYGQQYTEDKQNGVMGDALSATEKKALEAVKEALRLDPRLKSLLRTLWDPTDTTKLADEENDLEVFHGSAEFKKLLE